MTATLESNLAAVRERIASAARAAGRAPGDVALVCVTKSVGAERALALARVLAAQGAPVLLAESRVDALERKAARLAAAGVPVRWHFIGPLQRNKARRALRLADAIHSVDSPRLLDALGRVAAEEGRAPGVHLEVNVAGEEEKHGFAPDEVPAALRRAAETGLPVRGLMGMAPRPTPDDPGLARARAAFERLAALRAELLADAALARCFEGGRCLLSMGMSGDLEQAVAAGADLVRVGGALFEGLPAEEEPAEA